MTKRKSTKGQTTIYQTLSIKLKIEHNIDPTKTERKLRGKGYLSSFASGTRRVTLATNPVINHELGKDRPLLTTTGTYTWTFVTQLLRNG